jgi:hypothetical protein
MVDDEPEAAFDEIRHVLKPQGLPVRNHSNG